MSRSSFSYKAKARNCSAIRLRMREVACAVILGTGPALK